MGRSTNPNNYSAFFWELLSLMEDDKSSITFDVPAGQASSLRRQFYAFIAALEAQANKYRLTGNMKAYGDNIRQANTLRGYLVRIEVDNETIHYTSYHDRRPAKLVFVNRDLDPLISDIMTQLREQTDDKVVLADEVIEKSVDSFFDTPLEVKDVHSTPEEPTE